MPHDALDPIPIACEIVTAIQTYVTRRMPAFDPVVVTIARIEAGTTDNVIPETASLLGTIRTLSAENRNAVHAGLSNWPRASPPRTGRRRGSRSSWAFR